MAFGKIMRRSAGISPGDTTGFLPCLSLEETLRRFRSEEPLAGSPWQDRAAGDVIEDAQGDARGPDPLPLPSEDR